MNEEQQLQSYLNTHKMDIHSMNILLAQEIEQLQQALDVLQEYSLEQIYAAPYEQIMKYKGLHESIMVPVMGRSIYILKNVNAKLALIIQKINHIEDDIIKFRKGQEQ